MRNDAEWDRVFSTIHAAGLKQTKINYRFFVLSELQEFGCSNEMANGFRWCCRE
jgi:hypothetical protein